MVCDRDSFELGKYITHNDDFAPVISTFSLFKIKCIISIKLHLKREMKNLTSNYLICEHSELKKKKEYLFNLLICVKYDTCT